MEAEERSDELELQAQAHFSQQQEAVVLEKRRAEEAEQRAEEAARIAREAETEGAQAVKAMEVLKKEIWLQLLEAKEAVRERLENMLAVSQRDKEQLLGDKCTLEESVQQLGDEVELKNEELAHLRQTVRRLEAGGTECIVGQTEDTATTGEEVAVRGDSLEALGWEIPSTTVKLPRLSRYSGEKQDDEGLDQFTLSHTMAGRRPLSAKNAVCSCTFHLL